MDNLLGSGKFDMVMGEVQARTRCLSSIHPLSITINFAHPFSIVLNSSESFGSSENVSHSRFRDLVVAVVG